MPGRALHRALLSVAVLSFLVACGSTPAGTSGGESTANTQNAEAATGEAAAVTYVDARYHYKIDAPGKMTANADGTASVIGPSERLVVTVVQGSRAADPAALARSDASSLPSSTASFHLVSGPSETTLNGRKVQKLVYTHNAGTSDVTGKALDLTGVRYYIPKDSGTLAVVAYAIVTNQYDPQGADDIATTFQSSSPVPTSAASTRANGRACARSGWGSSFRVET